MFKKLLIANRGEIACRIIRTARKLNIRTVAVYSEIDADALHVQLADESYCIGPAPSIASYLQGEKIIAVAKAAQAEAIHPGYGFLSEDDEFAAHCQQAKVIFIGPPPQAIRAMGDKNLAKTTMMAAGVPVVPGYQGDTTDLAHLTAVAQKIGLPILIKASAGGGGKGMRLVHHLDELADALQSAQREAQASFGDSRVFLEKYLTAARHIEVQILFDQYGRGVYLFDRDCSIQRRHQKVIEEAPAPGLDQLTRQKMAETALRAGEAIQYCSAGTIEFLVDAQQNFYFMEMNTRLQVEHPITEMITGLDLVEWQLRIAAGEKLTLQADEIKIKGHAIEARLYAENPQNNFMPSAGRLQWLQLPAEQTPGIRVDSGFRTGDTVSVYYDPLLAKLVAWGENRQQAINTLQYILSETAVMGIHTNWTLLNRIIQNPQFIQANITTQFIAEQQTSLLAKAKDIPDEVIAMACLAQFTQQQHALSVFRQASEDIFSPWLLPVVPAKISIWQAEKNWQISVISSGNCWQLDWHEHHVATIATWQDKHHLHLQIGKQAFSGIIFMTDEQIHVFHVGEQWSFSPLNSAGSLPTVTAEYGVQAPMPGTLVEIYVQAGQTVNAGDRLLVMEAMKMEHPVIAPRAGKIATIFYKPGDRVNEGAQLIAFAHD